jgi:heme-degrading monooxygenase HmoA
VIIRLRQPVGVDAMIEETYRQISWVRGGIPGLRRIELMRDLDEADSYLVLSEWNSLAEFRTWQEGADHKNNPSALREFQDRTQGRHWALYEVTSAD